MHLFCQDREAAGLSWIDSVVSWEGGEPVAVATAGLSPGSGSVTAWLPDIGGLLPVYVEDRYTGFRVKTFPAMSDAEIETYLTANAEAVKEAERRLDGFDAALANHLIMGPAILARAGVRFAAKVHGSALSYTVKPHPRFLPYAKEGVNAAEAILVGSSHTARSLWATMRDVKVERKTRLGPPGVDVERFAPADRGQADEALLALADRLGGMAPDPGSGGDSFGRDGAEAAAALRAYAAAPGMRVLFVGKLIVSKGADLLLASWPLVRAASPDAELLIVGFGAYRDGLERLWSAIVGGDLAAAREVASAGWSLEGGAERPLRILSAFLADPPAGWREAGASAAGSVHFCGRLEHSEVADAVAASDAMVVPSTFPEAFGMVAAEAASAGALPVCSGHSGLAEVASALDAAMPPPARGLTSFPIEDDAVEAIADRLVRWSRLDPELRSEAELALRTTVAERWSWEGVARGVLAASAGDLDGLDPIPLG